LFMANIKFKVVVCLFIILVEKEHYLI